MRACVGNVVFDAPAPSIEAYGAATRSIAAIYAALLGLEVSTRAEFYRSLGYPADDGDAHDHMVRNPNGPSIAFEPVHGRYEPVRLDDPDHPAHIRVDVAVPDLDDARRRVTDLGATFVGDEDGCLVFVDPVGHPFGLVATPAGGHLVGETATAAGGGRAAGRMHRIVIDSADPAATAAFYRGLTSAGSPTVDTADLIELTPDDPTAPAIAVRRVEGYEPPTWPTPGRPQQVHLDWNVDGDAAAAGDEAVALGATALPYQGGGFVYADPAGHPFCLGE